MLAQSPDREFTEVRLFAITWGTATYIITLMLLVQLSILTYIEALWTGQNVCHFLFLFFYFCSINDKTNWVFDLFTNDEQFDNFIVYPLAMLLQVFINTELYARVSVAVLFDHLWKQIEVKSTLETEEALRSGKLFLLKLLDSAVQPFSLWAESMLYRETLLVDMLWLLCFILWRWQKCIMNIWKKNWSLDLPGVHLRSF